MKLGHGFELDGTDQENVYRLSDWQGSTLIKAQVDFPTLVDKLKGNLKNACSRIIPETGNQRFAASPFLR